MNNISTDDPDRDYALGWNWGRTTPAGASSDFTQGNNDRCWAIQDGRSTALEDSPRWKKRASEQRLKEQRAREVAYMLGEGE